MSTQIKALSSVFSATSCHEVMVAQGPKLPGLQYFTTTRLGGASQGAWSSFKLGAHCDDDPKQVAHNRALLQQFLPAPIPWLHQVHGTAVAEFDLSYTNVQGQPKADAALTRVPGCAIAVLTADCLPIVICDAQSSIVAVVHAGWRGLAQGIIERTAQQLQQHRPDSSWWAWIGPAIGPLHFEVGPEVRQAFIHQTPQDAVCFRPGVADKWWADLPALARLRLERSFQSTIKVYLSEQCTFTEEALYYSYRRDKSTGRMATVAWLTG